MARSSSAWSRSKRESPVRGLQHKRPRGERMVKAGKQHAKQFHSSLWRSQPPCNALQAGSRGVHLSCLQRPFHAPHLQPTLA